MKKLIVNLVFLLLVALLSACVHETIGAKPEKPIALKTPKHPCETFYRSSSMVSEQYSHKMVLSYKVQVKNKKGFLECEKLVQDDLDKVCESGKYSGIDLQFIPLNMKNVVAYKKGSCRANEDAKNASGKFQFVATQKMRLHKQIN
jgi:hypothetical protein